MPAPFPPELVDTAFLMRAKGYSLAASGRAVGASAEGVRGWLSRMDERYQRVKALAQHRWGRNVLRSADAVSRALVTAASDPTLRHGPQAARVLLEGAGIIGGVRDLTINGDVDASTNVTVDARRVSLIQGARGAELDAHVSDLAKDLGLSI